MASEGWLAVHFRSILDLNQPLTFISFGLPIGFSGGGRFTWWQGSGPAPLPAPSHSSCPMWMQLTKWLRGAPLTSLKVPYRFLRENGRLQCWCVWNMELCQRLFSDHGACFGHSFSSGGVWSATWLYCSNDRIDHDYQTVLRANPLPEWGFVLRDSAWGARHLVSAPLGPLLGVAWHTLLRASN